VPESRPVAGPHPLKTSPNDWDIARVFLDFTSVPGEIPTEPSMSVSGWRRDRDLDQVPSVFRHLESDQTTIFGPGFIPQISQVFLAGWQFKCQ